VARENEALTAFNRLEERQYYKTGPQASDYPVGLPRLCVALSGGGFRAAAFSAGVLAGMQADLVLPRVDVLSAVSGGSWAAAWFLDAQRANDIDAAHLFEHEGDVASGDYERQLGIRASLHRSRSIPWVAVDSIHAALVLLFNPIEFISGRNLRYLSLHETWRQQLQYVFLFDSFVTLDEVRHWMHQRSQPVPVINLTAVRSLRDLSPDVIDTTFELSVLRSGSPRLGYSISPPAWTLDQSIALSSAALPHLLSTRRFFHPGRPGEHSARGQYLTFTDGGLSENSGALPLINRLCHHIVVVDAEADPHLQFTAYSALKRALGALTASDAGRAELSVPAIDALLAKPAKAPDEIPYPVLHGTVGPFPFPGATDPDTTLLYLSIDYLKLSLDRGRLGQGGYSDAVRAYYARRGHGDCAAGCFPQEPTDDVLYDVIQWTAYRDLGFDAARLLDSSLPPAT
jgi:patatin-like phospholipase